jgi:hypothetical protein
MELGQKMSEMYDHPTSKDQKYYPEVSLTAKMFNNAYKVGDKVKLEFTGTIENMGKETFRIKLLEGSECGTKKEKKAGLISSAKAGA